MGYLVRGILLLLMISCVNQPPSEIEFTPREYPTTSYSLDEQYIFNEVNRLREEQGITRLISERTHERFAEQRTTDCVESDSLSHEKFYIVLQEGVDLGLITLGENLAYGFSSAESTMRALTISEGHKDNYMDPQWIYTGVSIVRDKEGKLYFCQIFGK